MIQDVFVGEIEIITLENPILFFFSQSCGLLVYVAMALGL